MLTVLLCFTMDELLNKELTVNSWHNVDSTINCRWLRLAGREPAAEKVIDTVLLFPALILMDTRDANTIVFNSRCLN